MTPDEFQDCLPYRLDAFQTEALAHLQSGTNVLVCAPTGAGKTIIAEFALTNAVTAGNRAFYTTPLKALSNQKFGELRERFGNNQVGLLTGDTTVNGDAPIIVMTTEVLRNMLYARAGKVADLACVVLDEIHFLSDPTRGPVWEEVLIHLSRECQILGLSATVANAEEFRSWIAHVHGPTKLVESTHRPVPLVHEFAVGVRNGTLIREPLFKGRAPNPQLLHDIQKLRSTRRARPPFRIELLEDLASKDQLPAIDFIFSRQGCDDAVRQCIDERFQLTNEAESAYALECFDQAVTSLGARDQIALGLDTVRSGFARGIAAHHAGQVPPIKEAIERAFATGAIKLVFATETLALGINMPARTVVLERLSRYTNAGHARLNSSEFIQIGGRAGRRGLDTLGRVVVCHSPWIEPLEVAQLAAAGPRPVESAFRPTYHMTANLIRHWDRQSAHAILERSFAAYRRERNRGTLERALEDAQAELANLLRDAESDNRLGAGSRSRVKEPVRSIAPGCVVLTPAGRRAVVVGEERDRFLAVDDTARLIRVRRNSTVLGVITLPHGYAPRKMGYRQRVASRVRAFQQDDAPPSAPRTGREVPRIDPRAQVLKSRIGHIMSMLDSEAPLREDFDRVLSCLEVRGCVDGWSLTSRGQQLADFTANRDLLIVESLEVMERAADAHELAALVSGLVYEARRDLLRPPIFPTAQLARNAEAILQIAHTINAAEISSGLPVSSLPDFGLAAAVYAWTSGSAFAEVIDEEFTSGGDFVRHLRQVLDVITQVAERSPALRGTSLEAIDLCDRGVVAASYSIGI